MSGGGGQQSSTTTTSIDPRIAPYVEYGLSEGKKLYEGAGPEYYKGNTYIGPSQQTTQALQAAQQRATAGSPLTQAAQAETLATIQGKGVNPFLAGALEQTNRLSGEDYLHNMQKLQSGASSMGRYGSGAQNQLTGQAQDVYARALTEQGGQLAYQSAEAERQRQMAAVGAAPAMANADYADIQKLLSVGGAKEAQSAAELQDAMNRFNFGQNLPQAKLSQFANLFSSVPQGTTTVQTATPTGGK
jgi:hypothetical protein